MVTHTAQLPKVLESSATVRFQDCDPFNHLNNARYIDYFMNAREDQILDNYGLDIYDLAMKTGAGWVVGKNQIAYFRPAKLMEQVLIQSQIIGFGQRDLTVELRMLDIDQTHVKAFMWVNFIHFQVKTGKSQPHGDHLMHLFGQVCQPIEHDNFDARFMHLMRVPEPVTA